MVCKDLFDFEFHNLHNHLSELGNAEQLLARINASFQEKKANFLDDYKDKLPQLTRTARRISQILCGVPYLYNKQVARSESMKVNDAVMQSIDVVLSSYGYSKEIRFIRRICG